MQNKFIVDSNNINKRLDVFLLEQSQDITRSAIKNDIDNGSVLVNNKNVKSGYKLKLNDEIFWRHEIKQVADLTPQDIDIEIVFENENVIVVNKPKGMVVHAGNGHKDNTLVNALLYKQVALSSVNGTFRPGIVHRLDKDTSGLMIVAKNDLSHVNLANQIKEKICHRDYIAIVCGSIKEDSGVIDTYIARDKKDRTKFTVSKSSEGKRAITHFKVLERYKGFMLVSFSLQTGRTHQIRVHTKYMGCYILGDNVYGPKKQQFNINGQLLIANHIEFFEPQTQQKLSFDVPPTQEFNEILEKIRKMNN